MPRRREPPHQPRQTIGLKFLAEYLDLSTATISVVLNDSPTAREIPAETRERVLAAARKFNSWSFLALQDQALAGSVDWAKTNLAVTDTPQSLCRQQRFRPLRSVFDAAESEFRIRG